MYIEDKEKHTIGELRFVIGWLTGALAEKLGTEEAQRVRNQAFIEANKFGLSKSVEAEKLTAS